MNKSTLDSFIDDVADFGNTPRTNIYNDIIRSTATGRAFGRHYRSVFGHGAWRDFLRLVRRRRLSPRNINTLKRIYFEGNVFGNFGDLKRTTDGIGQKVEVDHLLEDRIFRIYADGSNDALTFGQRKMISDYDGSRPDPFHNVERGRTDSLSAIVPIDDIVMHQMLLAGIYNAPYIHINKTARINQLIPLGMETAIPITDLWNRQRYGVREFFPINSFDEFEEEVREHLIDAVLHGIVNNREHGLLCEILTSSTQRTDHLGIIRELERSTNNLDEQSDLYGRIKELLENILELGNDDDSLFSSVVASQFGTD